MITDGTAGHPEVEPRGRKRCRDDRDEGLRHGVLGRGGPHEKHRTGDLAGDRAHLGQGGGHALGEGDLGLEARHHEVAARGRVGWRDRGPCPHVQNDRRLDRVGTVELVGTRQGPGHRDGSGCAGGGHRKSP